MLSATATLLSSPGFDSARIMDEGGAARVETSMVKFHTIGMLQDVINRATQVHIAVGLTADLPLERMYRDARAARIYDGPDEVHRMHVAREYLDNLERNAPWR